MKAERLKSGNYRVKVYLGKVKGKQKWISVTAPTATEAERRADIYRESDWTLLTVETACRRYIALREEELSPSTVRGYEGTMSAYIENDKIGGVKLGKLSNAILQEWVNRMKTAKKTKRNHLGFLIAALRFAGVDKIFRVRIAEAMPKAMYTPTVDEVNAVMDLLDDETHLAACLGCLGLRRGEICALTVDDVNVKQKTLSVTKALAKTKDGAWVCKSPKTPKSRRVIDIPEGIIGLLPDHGRLIKCSPDCITNRFAHAVEQAGVHPFRFHDLRSFSASTMLSEGAARASVRAVHGWKTDRMLSEHYEREAADRKAQDEAKIISFMSSRLHIRRNG